MKAAGWAVLLTVCLTGVCGPAVCGQSPFVKQTSPRRDARRGVIVRSDGSTYGGLIYTTRAAKIDLWDPDAAKWMEFRLEAIKKIEFTIAQEEQAREWKFREGGHDDKVFTGRVKLDRKYSATITYEEKGVEKTVSGHVKGAPIYVEHWDGSKYRFLLRRHHSGDYTEPDKVETSLPFTRTVDFTRDPDAVKKQMEKSAPEDEEQDIEPEAEKEE